jgi:hypothetical protein
MVTSTNVRQISFTVKRTLYEYSFCLDRVECKYKSKYETLCQSKVLLHSKAEKGRFVSIGKFRGFEKKQLD